MTGLSTDVVAFLESMVVPGVLSTLRPDGSPITSAVWFGFLDGDIVISTPAGRNKARNAREDGRVSFLVDTKERPYRGVAIEGVAELLDDPDGALVALIARRYVGAEADAWVAARSATAERVILRIRPRRVRPWNMAASAAQQVQ
ncbi:MAG: PPOX class F420-dependent oxidoreductase [Anaerolinea sp.]|nr:PPOX class F420-dependent oxidoreductase [Anaerolinea sp.]